MSRKKAISSSLLCFLTVRGDATPLASDLTMAAHNEREELCHGEQRSKPAKSTRFSDSVTVLQFQFSIVTLTCSLKLVVDAGMHLFVQNYRLFFWAVAE